VALAAIQGLHQKLEERDARIRELESAVAELKAMMKHDTSHTARNAGRQPE
jgi:hypothetical protein